MYEQMKKEAMDLKQSKAGYTREVGPIGCYTVHFCKTN